MNSHCARMVFVLRWQKNFFFRSYFFSKSGLSLQGGFPTDKYGHFLRSCHSLAHWFDIIKTKNSYIWKKNGMIENVIIHQFKLYSCSFLRKFLWNWFINKLIIRDCQWPEYRLFLFLRIKPYLFASCILIYEYHIKQSE